MNTAGLSLSISATRAVAVAEAMVLAHLLHIVVTELTSVTEHQATPMASQLSCTEVAGDAKDAEDAHLLLLTSSTALLEMPTVDHLRFTSAMTGVEAVTDVRKCSDPDWLVPHPNRVSLAGWLFKSSKIPFTFTSLLHSSCE